MSANDTISAQRLILIIGDGHINIKIKMIGFESLSFGDSKGKSGRQWGRGVSGQWG
jgi:hypothetical protein